MFTNYFACSDLSCFCKRNFFVVPWCLYHPLLLFFTIADSIFYNKPHTVDQTHFSAFSAWHLNLRALFRNKFWLCRHDCFSVGRLWQFISGTHFFRFVLHFRYDHQFHEIFDKCTFSGADRAYDTQIQFSAGSCIDIFIYIIFIVHKKTPLLNCYSICKEVF